MPSGKGKVESFTVIYGGKGDVEHGVVMMRTGRGGRALRGYPRATPATLAHLLNMDRTPVGSLARWRWRTTACWSGGRG